ncbi:hypothetical protein B0H13DRAFT_2494595 [Mycena leptocephala]|nr:hypothetical protein B0H13DRAFT_2494595 [Mycena leptocephala]
MSRRTRTTQGSQKLLCALASPPLSRLVPLANGQLNLEYIQYALDLGADTDTASVSTSPTPAHRQAPLKAPRNSKYTREQEADCGICFEHAVSPVRTSCCAHVFCAEHIAAWLHGPASDGRCPACRARVRASPATVLPSESPSISDSDSNSNSSPPSPASSLPSISDSIPEYTSPAPPSESEDHTDYSFPALQHARLLQTRRHAPHPLSSLLGLRGAALSLARALGCVAVVAVLAGGGGGGVGGGRLGREEARSTAAWHGISVLCFYFGLFPAFVIPWFLSRHRITSHSEHIHVCTLLYSTL